MIETQEERKGGQDKRRKQTPVFRGESRRYLTRTVKNEAQNNSTLNNETRTRHRQNDADRAIHTNAYTQQKSIRILVDKISALLRATPRFYSINHYYNY